jgi:hypothetical protein
VVPAVFVRLNFGIIGTGGGFSVIGVGAIIFVVGTLGALNEEEDDEEGIEVACLVDRPDSAVFVNPRLENEPAAEGVLACIPKPVDDAPEAA